MNKEAREMAIKNFNTATADALEQLTDAQLDLLIALCEAKPQGEARLMEIVRDAEESDCKAIAEVMRYALNREGARA